MAYRPDRAFRLIELQTGIVPFEAAMGDDLARLLLEIVDDLFVLHLKHDAGRQNIAPMRHHLLVGSVIAPQFPKIVGINLAMPGEKYREDRKAGIDGVAAGVNDARVGQGCVNEAGKSEVCRQLICDAGRARPARRG